MSLIVHRFDQRFFACIQKAWVVQRNNGFELTLETSLILPPGWLKTLAVTLIHENGTHVPCLAAWQDRQCSMSTARLLPIDRQKNLKQTFGLEQGTALCHVGQVLITGTQASVTLDNGTSHKAYQQSKTARLQEPLDGLISSLDSIQNKTD